MKYCLRKSELDEFVRRINNNDHRVEDEQLAELFSQYDDWETKLIVINYLYSQLLQRKIKRGEVDLTSVSKLYETLNNTNLYLEEFSEKFVEFILGHLTNTELSLEDHLVLLNNKFSDYDFSEQIRG